jgi:hypothetical protein
MGFVEIRSDDANRKASDRGLVTKGLLRGAYTETSVHKIAEKYSMRKCLRKRNTAGDVWHNLTDIEG